MKPNYIKPNADECFSGPPPEIGWWPASVKENSDFLRYWNGEFWSEWATGEHTADEAAYFAGCKSRPNTAIKWTKRWWEKQE